MTTIEIKYTLSDILIEKELITAFTCSICFEPIRNKETLQCKEGHWNCKECWVRLLNVKKECPLCRVKIDSINDLSRNRFLENEFSLKKVNCPNLFLLDTSCDFDDNNNSSNHSIDKESGCNEVTTIDKLDKHLEECKFKYVKCKSQGCNSKFRLNQLNQHIEQCEFNQKYCKYCKNNNITGNLSEHFENYCEKFKIKCTQNCNLEIERGLLSEHIKTTCPLTVASCVYSKFGCDTGNSLIRSELSNHLNSIDHSKYMNALIVKHDSELKETNSNFKLLLDRLNSMEALITNQSEIINKLVNTKATTTTTTTNTSNNQITDNLYDKLSKYRNKWTISNYSKSKDYKPTQRLNSPVFEIIGKKFEISVYPNGYNNEYSGYLSTYLFLKSLESSISVYYSVTLVNHKDSRKNITIKSEQLFSSSSTGWGRAKLIKSSEISISNGWLTQDDKLTLLLDAEILNKPTPFSTSIIEQKTFNKK